MDPDAILAAMVPQIRAKVEQETGRARDAALARISAAGAAAKAGAIAEAKGAMALAALAGAAGGAALGVVIVWAWAPWRE